MIEVDRFFKFLNKSGINFFAGVPDSILKNTKNYLEKKSKKYHVVTANEGLSIALCIGYFLKTRKLPCAYMQNSGFGNAINPLISIAHKKVYSIPLFLIIGWRGYPGSKDEPQHLAKGEITTKLLKLLNIKYYILGSKNDLPNLKNLINFSKKNNSVVACLVKKNYLLDSKKVNFKKNVKLDIKREIFIKALLENISSTTNLISTTGYTSRELNQIRKNYNLKKGRDFYMVGGMGHASMVSLGASLFTKNKTICIDGDGSMLMHMGSLANIGNFAGNNYKHILLNNFSHESVGGQKTFSENLDFGLLTKGAGYKNYFYLNKKKNIKSIIKRFLLSKGPCLLEVAINQGSMNNLSRPKDLFLIKKKFMKN